MQDSKNIEKTMNNAATIARDPGDAVKAMTIEIPRTETQSYIFTFLTPSKIFLSGENIIAEIIENNRTKE